MPIFVVVKAMYLIDTYLVTSGNLEVCSLLENVFFWIDFCVVNCSS